MNKTKRQLQQATYNKRAWKERDLHPKLLNHLVATRLTKKLDKDFRAQCRAMKKRPSTQIRDLIMRFTWGRES